MRISDISEHTFFYVAVAISMGTLAIIAVALGLELN
jgi:hypothetical protein